MADQGDEGGPAGSGGASGSGDHGGGADSASSANAGPGPGEGVDAESRAGGTGYGGLAGSLGVNDDRGFFGGIMDAITDNPVASGLQALGMLTGVPALGMMGLMAHAGKAFGDSNSVGAVGPGPGDGDGPAQIQQIVPPAFNPIEDMVGSEYVAYGGVGADQLRKQLFPYMNFNQPTQPGLSGLMGQYAGVGQGTGLMTGPFGMSNTQV